MYPYRIGRPYRRRNSGTESGTGPRIDLAASSAASDSRTSPGTSPCADFASDLDSAIGPSFGTDVGLHSAPGRVLSGPGIDSAPGTDCGPDKDIDIGSGTRAHHSRAPDAGPSGSSTTRVRPPGSRILMSCSRG
ncbi:hypothetical protein PV779_66945, partial [Streptomyces sp. ID01-9D]|nr:hypothetical protein [Streptomyces sp. ID01-9D]